jgi:hypothetical protein
MTKKPEKPKPPSRKTRKQDVARPERQQPIVLRRPAKREPEAPPPAAADDGRERNTGGNGTICFFVRVPKGVICSPAGEPAIASTGTTESAEIESWWEKHRHEQKLIRIVRKEERERERRRGNVSGPKWYRRAYEYARDWRDEKLRQLYGLPRSWHQASESQFKDRRTSSNENGQLKPVSSTVRVAGAKTEERRQQLIARQRERGRRRKGDTAWASDSGEIPIVKRSRDPFLNPDRPWRHRNRRNYYIS